MLSRSHIGGEARTGPGFCGRCDRPFGAGEMFCPNGGDARSAGLGGPAWQPPIVAPTFGQPRSGVAGGTPRYLRPSLVPVAIVAGTALLAFPKGSDWTCNPGSIE